MKIGFIGLGAMGAPMAERLLSAGHDLRVYNRTREKAYPLQEKGAFIAQSPADAAKGVEVVFTMLLNDAAVEDATFGENGLAQTLEPEAIHACCVTISTEQAERLVNEHKKRGQNYVTANVLGRPPAAKKGELYVITGGDKDLIERLTPLYEVFGQKIFNVGSHPVQANLVKLSLNFMIFSTIEQMSEVFALNQKAGTDPKTVFDVMINSFYSAPVHKNYGQQMIKREYQNPGAPVTLGYKDISLVLQAGEALQTPLPYASIVRDRFLAAMSAGDAENDIISIQECARRDSGL